MSRPNILTLAEAAPIVGLSPASLRLYAERGTLRATKVGKTWVVTEAEARRFAAVPRVMGAPRRSGAPARRRDT